MAFHGKADFNPWKRNPIEEPFKCITGGFDHDPYRHAKHFKRHRQNEHLDIYTKKAALRASPSVVSLESHFGEHVILHSGFIIESVDTYSVILTSARVLKCSTRRDFKADDIKIIVHLADRRAFDGVLQAHDFVYNIAAIKIHTDEPLPTVSLAQLKDSITVDLCQPRPHSRSFDLVPGVSVIALGRYIKTYGIMAAPGVFSIVRWEFDSKELFRATCSITECGIGGPLINHHGEVIGISLHEQDYHTAFMPINIASRWWEHYKKYRKSCRPWLGMQVTNLYAVPVGFTERIIRKFPDVSTGVVVEKVVGSSAASAGIKQNDVIVEFAGQKVNSLLRLFEIKWNKVGESVELTVIRERKNIRIHLSMVVTDAASQ